MIDKGYEEEEEKLSSLVLLNLCILFWNNS